jgi:hypothetical protein
MKRKRSVGDCFIHDIRNSRRRISKLSKEIDIWITKIDYWTTTLEEQRKLYLSDKYQFLEILQPNMSDLPKCLETYKGDDSSDVSEEKEKGCTMLK